MKLLTHIAASRGRTILAWGVALCCSAMPWVVTPLVATASLCAQGERERIKDSAKEIRKRALRLIRLLELPNRRAEVVPKILAMGKDAVPALLLALNDPRPEVVGRLALIVRALGPDATPTLPIFQKIAKDKDADLAYAGNWGVSLFEPKGIILYSDNGGPIKEIDAKGKQLWELPNSRSAYHVERLPNGHYLVAMYSAHEVREVDRKGKILWQCKAIQFPSSATRLPTGNTLISSSSQKKVIEVDPQGKVVWERKCNSPYSAQRLNNGNTLIPDYGGNEVLEVDRKGKVVWSYKSAKNPLDAQRLPNGNTLIACYSAKHVIVVTPKGKVIRTLKTPGNPWSCEMRNDGKIIVAGQRFVMCFDKAGKTVWKHKVGQYVTSIHVY